jgi:acyl-CoA thioester hydrolase
LYCYADDCIWGTFMSRNSLQYSVQWGDTDAAGIVFYPNYFRWFDHAALEFLRSIGWPLEVLRAQFQIVVPIIEASCRFQKPLHYHDLLTIETVVTEVRTRSFRLEHRVSRGEEITGMGYEVRGMARVPAEGEGMLELVVIPEDVRACLL